MILASMSGKLSEMEMSSLSSDRGKSHGHHNTTSAEYQQQQQQQQHASSHRGGGLFGGVQQPPPQPQQTKRLGRTPSSPSVFFSKVKERIREKVYETSAEWPHMAAIVQERRQRAADAFEARMSIHRQNVALQGHSGSGNESEIHAGGDESSHKGRRVRIKSDQAVHHRASPSNSSGSGGGGSGGGGGGSGGGSGVSNSFDKDGAKSAFRRRSISEDTYNRQPGSCAQQHTEDRGGVVCSNDELRAIVFEHKLRRSPVALKNADKGSGSLECCQESTISCDSLSNNSVTSNPKLHSCRADGAHFPPTSAKESPPILPLSSSTTQGFIAEGVNSGKNSCRVSLTITGADDIKTSDPLSSEEESSERIGSDTRRNSVVIREVVFDEHGQTWDIYGAEFDPEILGQAIQSHLEKMMKKKMVDRSKILNATEPALCTRSDSPNECRPMCANDERRTQRAFGFFLRYLCSVAKRKEQVTG